METYTSPIWYKANHNLGKTIIYDTVLYKDGYEKDRKQMGWGEPPGKLKKRTELLMN